MSQMAGKARDDLQQGPYPTGHSLIIRLLQSCAASHHPASGEDGIATRRSTPTRRGTLAGGHHPIEAIRATAKKFRNTLPEARKAGRKVVVSGLNMPPTCANIHPRGSKFVANTRLRDVEFDFFTGDNVCQCNSWVLSVSLREEIQCAKDNQRDGLAPRSRIYLHNVIAEYTLRQELGEEKVATPFRVYELNDETRDRLIAHTRQDASLAVIITSEVEKRLVRIERILIFIFLLLVWLAWKTFA